MNKEMNAVIDYMRSVALILEPIGELYTGKKTFTARCLAKVNSEALFLVHIDNFSDTPVRLQAGWKIGYAIIDLCVKAQNDQS